MKPIGVLVLPRAVNNLYLDRSSDVLVQFAPTPSASAKLAGLEKADGKSWFSERELKDPHDEIYIEEIVEEPTFRN